MHELSRFLGIIIRMYMEAVVEHKTPHFHAYYQEQVAVYSVEDINLLAGSIPKRQQRFVDARAELHKRRVN